MSAPCSHLFPLRWESTGDQWWYVSPIDWAAANGHYDVVRELLHLDPNLLIKLTSLRRIRRLETVWEDDDHHHSQFQGAAVCRAHIAKSLLTESENNKSQEGPNKSLIGAGYGGWLLYTAAAGGDTGFVSELLERDPLLVFGEGEYGVTDVLYAAARSKNSEVFRLLLNMSLKLKGAGGRGGGGERGKKQQQQLREEEVVDGMNDSSSSRSSPSFRWEMMNRAAHAAARGGNMEMMREIISMECKDVLAFRDAQGSTLLHSASARGQLEVVMDLISSYGGINIVSSRDNHGNRALDVAAYRGHLPVVQALLLRTGTSSSQQILQVSEYQNNYGDTFLHMAVAGFTTPGFRRVDHQMNLMKHLTTNYLGNLLDHALINVRNNEGRTALHCAVALNIPCEVVHLLMSIPYINLNIRDHNGKTPFDLLLLLNQQQPSSSSNSEILIKRLMISSNNSQLDHHFTRRALASHLRSQSFLLSQHHQTHYADDAGNSSRMLFMMRSPGASFRISDADILFYADHDNNDASNSSQGTFSGGDQQLIISNSCASGSIINSKSSSVNNAAMMRLKLLLRWPKKMKKNKNDKESSRPCSPDLSYCDGSNSSSTSDNEESPKLGQLKYSPTPLRQRFGNKQYVVLYNSQQQKRKRGCWPLDQKETARYSRYASS